MRFARLRLLVPLFWALWLTIVALSNLTNALKVAGWLPAGWAFASSNFQLIEAATSIYSMPRTIVWALFFGVIAWQALAAGLFWRLVRRRLGGSSSPLEAAFGAAAGLFAAFMVADELLISYPIQATHMRVFVALLASYLVMRGGVAERAE